MGNRIVFKHFELLEGNKGFPNVEKEIAEKYTMYRKKDNPNRFLQVEHGIIGYGAMYMRDAKYQNLNKEHISKLFDDIAEKGMHLHLAFDEDYVDEGSDLYYLPTPAEKKELFVEMKELLWDDMWEFMSHFVITIPIGNGNMRIRIQKNGILTFDLYRVETDEQTLQEHVQDWVQKIYGNGFSFSDWKTFDLPLKKEVRHEFSDLHIIVDYLNNSDNLPEEVKKAFSGDLKRTLEKSAKTYKDKIILR